MEKFDNVEYFTNRELSWLKFNIRVLNEAEDDNPIYFERILTGGGGCLSKCVYRSLVVAVQ